MKADIIDVFGSDAKISRMARISYGQMNEKSEKDLPAFIEHLLRHKHLVPFEHCSITYYLECPIYVARQIERYRTAVISEQSLRYCEPSVEHEIPDVFSGDTNRVSYFFDDAYLLYQGLLFAGAAMESARAVLPLCTRTKLYYTMNLRNLMHFFEQRCSPHAQPETRQLAEQMLARAKEAFPVTFNEFMKLGTIEEVAMPVEDNVQ